MDLNCSLKFGLSQEAIKPCRREWSLAHDVKLLKFLENFSQNLISRTGEALKALEQFEKDLFSLSLNIQTVSHRFQSLANKQFIEHCVYEDDLSTYSKPIKNAVGVTDGTSNDMLNKALTSCLSSLTLKHNSYEDGYPVNRTNALYDTRPLPFRIGTKDFTDLYSQLLLSDEKINEPMQRSEIATRENISDQQSIPDSLSLHSASSNVVDEDRNSYCANLNNEVDYSNPSNSSMSSDLGVNNQDISAVPNIKRTSNEWLSQDNFIVRSNGFEVTPPNSHSLFDDDEVDSEDLFSFAKVNPFEEKSVEPLKLGIPSKESADIISSSDWDDSNSKVGEGTMSSDDKVIDHKSKSSEIKVNSPPFQNVNHNLETNMNLQKEYLPVSKNDMNDHLPSSDRINKNILSASMNESLNYSIKDTFSSNIKPYSSKDANFSLFSDEDPSDDEILFNSPKNKSRKEKFKKLLEEKISSSGLSKTDSKFRGLSNPPKQINPVIAESTNKKDSLESKTVSHEDNSLLPKYDTSTLHSLAKNRPRIRNKRRPPSRKHLKGFQPTSDNNSEDREKVSANDDLLFNQCSKAVSVLSPSTEEEDLFIVPASSIAHEASCSNLFSASSLLSPGSSLDNTDECFADQITKNSIVSTLEKNEGTNSFEDAPSSFITTLLETESVVSSNSAIKADDSSKFFWNNDSSLFNDSEDDDDDLFSSTSSKKLSKKIVSKTNGSDVSEISSKNKSSVIDSDFFDDLFSQNSDDDSLFKVKKISPLQTNSNKNSKGKEGNNNNHPTSLGKNVTSNVDFKDPLSSFNEN